MLRSSSSRVLTTSPDKLTKWPYTTAGGGWIKVIICYRYNGGVYRVYTDNAVISSIYHHYYSWHPLATLITYYVSANIYRYAGGRRCYSIMAYKGRASSVGMICSPVSSEEQPSVTTHKLASRYWTLWGQCCPLYPLPHAIADSMTQVIMHKQMTIYSILQWPPEPVSHGHTTTIPELLELKISKKVQISLKKFARLKKNP